MNNRRGRGEEEKTVNRQSVRAEKVADRVAGELRADPERKIYGVKGAGSVDSSTLTYAEDERFLQQALKNEAALILLSGELYRPEISAIICDNPRLAYARAAELFPDRRYHAPGVDPAARVVAEASLGENVSLHAGVVVSGAASIGDNTRIAPGCLLVGDVEIGEDCLLHPGVKILPGTKIGDRVEIQAGAVIGSDGFGYAADDSGTSPAGQNSVRSETEHNCDRTRHYKIPQQGGVVIEDDVEIGAQAAVDRAVEGVTRIGAGSKVDNLVQISHNVNIGPAALIAGQSGIAGSSSLGREVTLAGQVGIEDHVQIGDDITFTGKAKVSKDITESGVYSGIPARPHRQYLRETARMRRISQLKSEIKNLQQELQNIREELNNDE